MTLLSHEKTGLPFAEGLETCVDLPHTITSAISHKAHMDSINEIPKDKRPPRYLWDKPWRLEQYIDKMYEVKDSKKESAEINMDNLE